MLLTLRRSVLKVGRYKKWQKLTQDMPFRPLFLLNLSRNQVFLLEIMYPNTSLLFDPNRSTHDEYIFPIITPNVSCKMYFVPYTLVTLPSYTYSSEVTRKQAQNMTFFPSLLLTKFVLFFKATLYPSIHYRLQPL